MWLDKTKTLKFLLLWDTGDEELQADDSTHPYKSRGLSCVQERPLGHFSHTLSTAQPPAQRDKLAVEAAPTPHLPILLAN